MEMSNRGVHVSGVQGRGPFCFSPGYSCSKNLGRPQVWEGQDAIEYDEFKDFQT